MRDWVPAVAKFRDWISEPEGSGRSPSHGSTSPAGDLVILAAVFLVARAVAIFAVLARGRTLVRSDGGNYIYIAESLLETGLLPLDQRQFPGFGILIALFSGVTSLDPVMAGLFLMLLSGLGAVCLFYVLTGNFRLAMLLIFFLPGWVSTGIMAEGLAMMCLLCTLVAFGRDVGLARGVALAFVGGLMLIIKPPMILAVLPLGAVAAWCAILRGRRDLLLCGLAFSLPFVVYFVWAQVTIGTFRPESAEQLRYTIEQSRDYYPARMLTWPGHSLALGLMNPVESPVKQASVVFTLLVAALGAVGLFLRGNASTPLGGTGTLLGLGLVFYSVFHLCIGGPWGFNTMERYIGVVSPLILIGIFGDRRPRWWLFICAVAGSMAYASLAGRQM